MGVAVEADAAALHAGDGRQHSTLDLVGAFDALGCELRHQHLGEVERQHRVEAA